MLRTEYIRAIDTRVRWLKWAIKNGTQVWGDLGKLQGTPFQEIIGAYIHVLHKGELFFMNKRFCSLVEHARQSISDEMEFDSSWMLTKSGWLWIEEPFSVPQYLLEKGRVVKTEVANVPVRVNAIGWFPVPEGSQTGSVEGNRVGRVAGKGCYELLCYQDFRAYQDADTRLVNLNNEVVSDFDGFGCWSYFMLQDGDKLITRIKDFENNALHLGGAYTGREKDALHEIRWIYAALFLMAQRLSVQVHHHVDRTTQKRVKREGYTPPETVKVISLRRLEADRNKEKGSLPGGVEWKWQWEVRGHWRNQYFKSDGTHRPVFIESFIKGPPDKPLKPPGNKIFIAAR